LVTEHAGGHLPFQTEVLPTQLSFDAPNRITVAVNNTLTPDTVPQGFLVHKVGEQYPPNHVIQQDNFDFFKYAGIHRSVLLYTTPSSFVDDITVTPTVTGPTGATLGYSVLIVGTGSVSVALVDKAGLTVATGTGLSGSLTVTNAKLWWPYAMAAEAGVDPGYLYTLKVPTPTQEGWDGF
jgi:beta-glucuronidase